MMHFLKIAAGIRHDLNGLKYIGSKIRNGFDSINAKTFGGFYVFVSHEPRRAILAKLLEGF
jgi:hypothetical protein